MWKLDNNPEFLRKQYNIKKVEITCDHEWEYFLYNQKDKCDDCFNFLVKKHKTHCIKCNVTLCRWCAANQGYKVPEYLEEKKNNIEEEFSWKQQCQIHLKTIDQLQKRIKELENKINILENSKIKDKGKGIKLNDSEEEVEYIERININKEIILKEGILIDLDRQQLNLRKRTNNNLLNIILTIEFKDGNSITAEGIIDTGATSCHIDSNLIEKRYKKMSGSQAAVRDSVGNIRILKEILEEACIRFNSQKYPLPITWVDSVENNDSTKIIIGMNFIRNLQGGIMIVGNRVTIFKKADSFLSTPYIEEASFENQNVNNLSIEEEEFEEFSKEDLFDEIENEIEECNINLGELKDNNIIQQILIDLEKIKIIGNSPLKYWENNKIMCKIDLINPNIVIKDDTIMKYSPQEEEEIDMHIKELEKKGLIRSSFSPHRSKAFIVNNHSEIVRGKSTQVYNYKRLNDNTIDDSYIIPDKETLVLKIKDSYIFTKADLKSGFWQVAMHPDSIKLTAFMVPNRHLEWLCMPFGLKNAPSIFQRKMDDIFRENKRFILCYIDDIIIFSNSKAEHTEHLKIFFKKCIDHGLILSNTKMIIGQKQIDFLGLTLGQGKLKLQDHIAKAIVKFPMKFDTLKAIRSFLGRLNYCRNYIPDFVKLTGPLYAKTRSNGVRYFNSEDFKLVNKIKDIIKNLPPLDLAPPDSYMVVETDGSLVGWGGILKWKKYKEQAKKEEKICNYCSGLYKSNVSSLDAEIIACMNVLQKFSIYLRNCKEFTLRTDCKSIVAFYNKLGSNKLNQNRWIFFFNFLIGNGYFVNIEHIDAKNNFFADQLSRIISRTQEEF